MRKKREKHFDTEADLCAAFIAEIGPEWICYPETAGWDILLVGKADGFQIGVQAKLKLNAHVITQAIEEYGSFAADRAGPDCRAVLVPEDATGSGFGIIAEYLGITIMTMRRPGKRPYYRNRNYQPGLPGDEAHSSHDWHEWAPAKRHKLPEYVPDVAAGAKSPIQLSQWKIKAIKIAIIVEHRGFVTRSDFRHLQLDHRRWLTPGQCWLIVEDGRYVPTTLMPKFKEQHPRVYLEIERDAHRWMPKQMDLLPAGG